MVDAKMAVSIVTKRQVEARAVEVMLRRWSLGRGCGSGD